MSSNYFVIDNEHGDEGPHGAEPSKGLKGPPVRQGPTTVPRQPGLGPQSQLPQLGKKLEVLVPLESSM